MIDERQLYAWFKLDHAIYPLCIVNKSEFQRVVAQLDGLRALPNCICIDKDDRFKIWPIPFADVRIFFVSQKDPTIIISSSTAYRENVDNTV